jgi:hypothetical protein
VKLVEEGHAGDDAEIAEWMSGNICRCAAYPNIQAAIPGGPGRGGGSAVMRPFSYVRAGDAGTAIALVRARPDSAFLAGGTTEVDLVRQDVLQPPPGPTRGPDLLLDGISLVICEGYPAGAPVLRQAVSAFCGTDVSREEGLRWLWLACRAALIVWDYPSWDVLSAARSRSPVTLVRLSRFPSPLTRARECTCSRGSSPRPPRWWRRLSR